MDLFDKISYNGFCEIATEDIPKIVRPGDHIRYIRRGAMISNYYKNGASETVCSIYHGNNESQNGICNEIGSEQQSLSLKYTNTKDKSSKDKSSKDKSSNDKILHTSNKIIHPTYAMVVISIICDPKRPLTGTYLKLLRLSDKGTLEIKANHYHIFRKKHVPRFGPSFKDLSKTLMMCQSNDIRCINSTLNTTNSLNITNDVSNDIKQNDDYNNVQECQHQNHQPINIESDIRILDIIRRYRNGEFKER